MIALIVDPTLSEHRFEKDILYLKENSNECARFGIKYIKYSYPYLTVEFKWKGNIRLCICAHNYNYKPVSGFWVDNDDKPLHPKKIPHGRGFQSRRSNFNGGWLCYPGWLEYHQHRDHIGDVWNNYRNKQEYRIMGLLHNINTELKKIAA